MDTAAMPMSSSGNNAFTCIVDTFTKLAKLYAHKDSITAPEHALHFMQRWHDAGMGLPSSIITNRDSKFMSKFSQSLMKQLGIAHSPSTSRHQATYGQSESRIKSAKYALKSFSDYNAANWDASLSAVEFALNDSISSATGYTPFYLSQGMHPRTVVSDNDIIPSKYSRTHSPDIAS
jgi:hypothetical protein